MKKTLTILAAACLFTGCSTVDKAILTPTVTQAPPVVTVATNADTGAFITNTFTPAPVTNYAVSPVASAAAQTISALPIPFAGTAGITVGFLLAVYSAWKNKKLSSALVTGIEAGRQILQQTPEGQALDAKVKDALISNQIAAGVLNQASKLVNDLTGDTVKPTA